LKNILNHNLAKIRSNIAYILLVKNQAKRILSSWFRNNCWDNGYNYDNTLKPYIFFASKDKRGQG